MEKDILIESIKDLEDTIDTIKNVEIGDTIIKVKQYLPIIEKMDLINQVVNISFQDKQGMKEFNSVLYDMALSYYLVVKYTNINLEANKFAESYDILKSTNLLSEILEAIPDSEFDFITSHIDNRIEQEKELIVQSGSFSNIIKAFLGQFSGDMSIMKDILDKFDPNAMDKVQEMIKATNYPEVAKLEAVKSSDSE